MHRYLCALVLTVPAAFGSGPAEGSGAANGMGPAVAASRPPVLRGAEPKESVTLRLPGSRTVPRSAPAPPVQTVTLPPATQRPAPPAPVVQEAIAKTPAMPRPAAAPAHLPKPFLPPDFERDSAAYTQKLIGQWTQPDAYNLFGSPLRNRPAFDTDHAENGRIYAYTDPTGLYREFELDFDGATGLLRTVFAYPWKMTWQDCRRSWGTKVSAAEASKGRTFYSYQNRRLDVLVDASGRVVSLGLY